MLDSASWKGELTQVESPLTRVDSGRVLATCPWSSKAPESLSRLSFRLLKSVGAEGENRLRQKNVQQVR